MGSKSLYLGLEHRSKTEVVEMQERDKQILRELAKRVAEIASDEKQEEKRQLWYAHNSLKPVRPMVLCFPEGAWDELLPQSVLECQDPLARSWEWSLRARIYIAEHFCTDEVIGNTFSVGYVYSDTGWGRSPSYIRSEAYKGAYKWDPPIKSYEDLQTLHYPEVQIDFQETERRLSLAHEIFDGILEVQLRTSFWWSMGLIGELALLRGLDQVMIDMCEAPEFVHSAMNFLAEGRLRWLKQLEELGVLSLNNGNHYVGSGGFGFTNELPAPDFNGKVRLKDMWGFAEAQEAVGISPMMFDEFVLSYQVRILEHFGLNCYGCCEPVHNWLDLLIAKVPRLRRVSVSPWCDRKIAAEKLGDKFIYSWKPHPICVSGTTFDPDWIRRYIRETLEIAKGCVVEIILKDTHTCHNQPWRFDVWTKIAMEEAERFVN
jgi:hypothetical protein